MPTDEQPLAPYRVLEIGTGAGALCGRVLADLGAEVVKVEPLEGDPMRGQAPLAGDTGISFLWYNANKRGVTLDLERPEEQQRLRDSLDGFDVLLDGMAPGWLACHGLDPEQLRAQFPQLVISSVSHFGQDGPYSGWQGSAVVDYALCGLGIRAGLPDAPPVAPPYQLAYVIGAVTAAGNTLLALWERGRSGNGDRLDTSVLEALVAQADWSLAGYAANGSVSFPRVGAGAYPLWQVSDGWVRIINLSAPQWRSFCGWLDNPPELAGPEWLLGAHRTANLDLIEALWTAKFGHRGVAELVQEGQEHGVAIVGINTPSDTMADPHFQERGTFVAFPLPDGRSVRAPGGFVRMHDRRPEPPCAAPAPGGSPNLLRGRRAPEQPQGGTGLPLSGLRVVEVGVAAVGPEVPRILGLYGADSIKLESEAALDFMRYLGGSENIEASFPWFTNNRNKRSVRVNLKHQEGNRLALALLDQADVFVENNSGGVMDRLGLSYELLAKRNPRLIYLSSQAFGSSGPKSWYGGFGPINQSVGGLTYLWNAPGVSRPDGTSTVFPDLVLGRVGFLAVMAALIERARTGLGQHIDMAQTEFAMASVAEAYIETDLEGRPAPLRGSLSPLGAPHGVFPCAGSDEWIAVSVENDAQWCALKRVIGEPRWVNAAYDTAAGRQADRDRIEAELAGWTAKQPKYAAMRILQQAGVPAGGLMTMAQVMSNPQLAGRGFFRAVTHDVLGPMLLDGAPLHAQNLCVDVERPAPLLGQHTDEVLQQWLGMDTSSIAALRDSGALR